ncbi:MAG TPA: hypothetical protein VJY42_04460 [Candidatus Methanomethylophilaceae archaeon]|nr:hypothetical protein [Candidatus Methanomethylophilaceae archaeon]
MNKQHKGILSDIVCITAFLILTAMTVGSYFNDERMGYQIFTGIFTALFCLVPLLFRRKNIMTLPLLLVIMIELAIFLHGYGVLLLQYDNLAWYDSVTHTTSSVVAGLCVFYALLVVDRSDDKIFFGRNGISIFIVLIMMALSVYWEVFELIVDVLTGTSMQYSPFDTMRDMMSNLLGGILVALYVRWFLGKYPTYDVEKEFNIHPKLIGIAAHSNHEQ